MQPQKVKHLKTCLKVQISSLSPTWNVVVMHWSICTMYPLIAPLCMHLYVPPHVSMCPHLPLSVPICPFLSVLIYLYMLLYTLLHTSTHTYAPLCILCTFLHAHLHLLFISTCLYIPLCTRHVFLCSPMCLFVPLYVSIYLSTPLCAPT